MPKISEEGIKDRQIVFLFGLPESKVYYNLIPLSATLYPISFEGAGHERLQDYVMRPFSSLYNQGKEDHFISFFKEAIALSKSGGTATRGTYST